MRSYRTFPLVGPSYSQWEPLRSMISSRTKEALARKCSEGKRLGRPKGKLSAVTKLTGKDDLIREYLDRKIPVSVISQIPSDLVVD